jgi:hypothetical protein
MIMTSEDVEHGEVEQIGNQRSPETNLSGSQNITRKNSLTISPFVDPQKI